MATKEASAMPYPYDPYPNPYMPRTGYGFGNQYNQPQPQPQTNTYAFVNGIEGAKSFPMAPNQTVMLMDSDNPIAYMKTSNGMGQASIKYFKLVETSEAELKGSAKPAVEYVSRSDFDALRKQVEELLTTKKEG